VWGKLYAGLHATGWNEVAKIPIPVTDRAINDGCPSNSKTTPT